MDYKKITASVIKGEAGDLISRDNLILKVEQKVNSLNHIKKSNVILINKDPRELVVEMLALWALECTVIPIQKETSEREINNIVDKIEVTYIIKDGNLGKKLNATTNIKNCILLLLTSGTTGIPKAVKISSESLDNKIKLLSEKMGVFETTLNALPLSFGHGLICNTLYPLFTSSRLVLFEKFDLELLLTLELIIEKYNINFFSSVPSVWLMKFKIQSEQSSFDMKSLVRVNVASSPLTTDLEAKILNWTKHKAVYDMYGSTEMLGWFAERKCGEEIDFRKKWDVEEKVVEDVLYLKSNYMFDGYLNIENSKDRDGYYNTGDVFRENKITGRIDEIVNKAGVKIYLEEIDNLVISSGLVMDACSYQIKDDISGERLGLAVVCAAEKSVDDVKEFLKKSLNNYKLPDEVRSVEKITRNERGKLIRHKNTGRSIE